MPVSLEKSNAARVAVDPATMTGITFCSGPGGLPRWLLRIPDGPEVEIAPFPGEQFRETLRRTAENSARAMEAFRQMQAGFQRAGEAAFCLSVSEDGMRWTPPAEGVEVSRWLA